MRRRLLTSILALVVAVLLAFALPLAFAVRGLLEQRALDTLQGEVEQIAIVLDERARSCAEVELVLGVLADRGRIATLSLFTREGGLVATSRAQQLRTGAELVAAVGQDRPGRAHRAGQLAVAVPLSTAVCGPRLILHAQEPDTALLRSVRGSWLALAGVGAVVSGIAVLAAALLGRRLSRPFEALAASARRLGDGDFTARAPRSGLPEANAVATALDTTADRLGRAVARGQAFTADAAHQLRTPLTALRLQLDHLDATTGSDREAVAAANVEVDRLDATIDELAALTRLDTPEEDVDLAALVRARLAAWRELAGERGRAVAIEVVPAPRVRARPGAIGQALQVLLDNAIAHGAGSITVRIEPVPRVDGATAARVCVLDEGVAATVATPPRRRDRGGGRGLVLARSLIDAEGGRLVLSSDRHGTRACILMPGALRADRPDSAAHGPHAR